MVTRYIETDEDANKFAQYIHKKGGKVKKIYALRQGYQFDIIRPDNVEFNPYWGQEQLTEYLSGKNTEV